MVVSVSFFLTKISDSDKLADSKICNFYILNAANETLSGMKYNIPANSTR